MHFFFMVTVHPLNPLVNICGAEAMPEIFELCTTKIITLQKTAKPQRAQKSG